MEGGTKGAMYQTTLLNSHFLLRVDVHLGVYETYFQANSLSFHRRVGR